jgi:hypothetical protein
MHFQHFTETPAILGCERKKKTKENNKDYEKRINIMVSKAITDMVLKIRKKKMKK